MKIVTLARPAPPKSRSPYIGRCCASFIRTDVHESSARINASKKSQGARSNSPGCARVFRIVLAYRRFGTRFPLTGHPHSIFCIPALF